jgi:hypothetical protein
MSRERRARAEAPSRTGYQGTAHRRAGTAVAISSGNTTPATRGATRGRPRGRGRGKSRGQDSVSAENFSFTAPNYDDGKPKRKRSLANAILNAPTLHQGKPVEHFKTPSMVRKAELAARSLADRAPDIQSIGPLSRPSDYGGGRTIRKRSQVLRDDLEMDHSNDNSALPKDDVEKSKQSSDTDEEKALLTRREFQHQNEIMEITSKLDLYKKNTPDQTASETDRLIRDPPQGVPTGSRAIIQDQVNTVAQQLQPPDSNIVRRPLHDDVDIPLIAELQTAMSPPGDKPRQSSKTVTKINLKEYKSRRKSEFLGDAVPAQAVFGNRDAAPILIGFTDIDITYRSIWVPMLSGVGVINFNRTCIAQEFSTQSAFLQSNVLATGNVIASAEDTATLEEVIEWLRPCSGLVFLHDVFCILIFPAKCEEWKFLDSNSDSNHRLRYQIYEPKSPKGAASQLDNAFAETIMSSLNLKRRYLDTLIDMTQNLQYYALLPPHLEGQDVHNFYLFFPKKVAQSAKYIITWLRACNRDCRIYTNQKSGSWDLFTRNPIFKAGTVIFHEHLISSISKIPRVARLINSNAAISFWCMDDGACKNPLCLDFGSDRATPSCDASMMRLFPHGGAVFLTPSFLITQPERTCDLLKWFQRKLSSSTLGTWRLVLPSGGCHYLLDLAIEMAARRENLYSKSRTEQTHDDLDRVAASQYISHQECKARFESYVLLDQMLKNEYMSGIPDYWEEDSPDDAESPIVYADKGIKQDDEKALVAWFAGWTMLHLNLYRKFFVLGTTPLKRRANALTVKSSGKGSEVEKRPLTASLEMPATSRETDTPATAVKRWNRNTFSGVKDSPISTTALPPNTNEPLNAQNYRTGESECSLMDLGGHGANTGSTSRYQHDKERQSDSVTRDTRQRPTTRHGIDENQPPSILEFIAITGTEAKTAKQYLTRYNGDVHTAVQRYWYSVGESSSPLRLPQTDGTDDSEDPVAVVDFIADTHASAQVAEKYLLLAQDDVRRAIALYNESQQHSRSPSRGLSNQDGIGVREDDHENGPSRGLGDPATLVRPEATYNTDQIIQETRNLQAESSNDSHSTPTERLTTPEQLVPESNVSFGCDGVDERQNEDGSRQSRKSGVVTNEAVTRHFVPRSVRPSGTVRPEISIRPGYMPTEDKPVYKNRRVVGGVPQYEVEEMGDSSSGSRNSSTVQSPTGMEMDTRRIPFPDTGKPLSGISKSLPLDPNFETTLEWYEKLRKNGQGWEHIYVGGWEACFPRLMTVKK